MTETAETYNTMYGVLRMVNSMEQQVILLTEALSLTAEYFACKQHYGPQVECELHAHIQRVLDFVTQAPPVSRPPAPAGIAPTLGGRGALLEGGS